MDKRYTTNRILKALSNTMSTISRASLANQIGQSFDGKRDLYESLGYPKTLNYDLYRQAYDRSDIARTIITAFPDATWVTPPTIRETEDVSNESTAFERDWKALIQRLPVFNYMNRADILSGIGSYGVMFMGFDDGLPFSEPVTNATELLYLRPLSQGSINDITEFEMDINSPRYGLPKRYEIRFGHVSDQNVSVKLSSTDTQIVHWTRVLHIADNKDESEVYGTPRLQPLYNRLYDMQKILGCSAEMFWQGAFQGLAFEADDEADIVDQASLEAEIQKYVHGMQRYLQLQGIKTKVLSSPVVSPKNHIDVQVQIISATTRIPMRILTGSERGELSSTQDENNWIDRVEERRNKFATDLLKTFIDHLIDIGVLSSPVNGPDDYFIQWNNTTSTTFKQKMETARIITDSFRMYVKEKIYMLMPPEQYLEKIMKFTPEQINQLGNFDYINELIERDLKQEENPMERGEHYVEPEEQGIGETDETSIDRKV